MKFVENPCKIILVWWSGYCVLLLFYQNVIHWKYFHIRRIVSVMRQSNSYSFSSVTDSLYDQPVVTLQWKSPGVRHLSPVTYLSDTWISPVSCLGTFFLCLSPVRDKATICKQQSYLQLPSIVKTSQSIPKVQTKWDKWPVWGKTAEDKTDAATEFM